MIYPLVTGMIYLACPYTNKYRDVERYNVIIADGVARRLISRRWCVYSPLSYSDKIDVANDYGYWMEHCLYMLNACNTIFVINADGWRESKGVKKELLKSCEDGIPAYLIDSQMLKVKHIKGFTRLPDDLFLLHPLVTDNKIPDVDYEL